MARTHEADQDFRSRYDELLHSCGFKFKRNAFYRCHANDVLLVISTIKRFPYFEVTFGALPFSCAYTDDGKWRGWGVDWFMANRAKCLGIAYARSAQDAYEVRNQRMYDGFSTVVFPELNKVCSLDTYFAYEEWFTESVGTLADSVSDSWVYLQNKDYAMAYNCIQRYLENSAARYHQLISAGRETEIAKRYEFWRNIADKIEKQQYDDVDVLTQNRMAITRDTCKRLGILQ